MNAKVAFKLVGIWRCIGAMWALIGTFASVTSHVALQFGEFHRSVITFGAAMWFFMGVSVANVSHQFSRCCESGFAEFALMRSNTGVSVDVILKRCKRLHGKEI